MNEFEYLCGYTKKTVTLLNDDEFFLTEEDQITIYSPKYEKLTYLDSEYRKLRNPYENDFEIKIKYYYSYNTFPT